MLIDQPNIGITYDVAMIIYGYQVTLNFHTVMASHGMVVRHDFTWMEDYCIVIMDFHSEM